MQCLEMLHILIT